MPVINHEYLKKISVQMFESCGATKEESQTVSDYLVKANLVGHDSHGIMRIPSYIKEIRNGGIRPGAKIRIIHESQSSSLLNGNWGFGQVIATKAMEIAIEKARNHSVSIVCIQDCNHIGRLADYTILAAEKNMVGIASVNDKNLVAPHGGIERILNTCPISFAFPTEGEIPFVLDMTTSVCAEGKIRTKLHRNEMLPNGCIINKNGAPTNKPSDFYEGGAILPLGGAFGYKGYGLGLVVEVLSGILSQDGCSFEKNKWGNGVFLQAINIKDFLSVEKFKNSIERLIQKLKSSRRRKKFTEILFPGEIEFKTEKRRLEKGIMIPAVTWKEIVETADSLGLSVEEDKDSHHVNSL